MAKILVAVDGSEPALRAVDYAVKRAAGDGSEIYLLNVQPPFPQSVASAAGSAVVHDYHREEAEKALGPAEARIKTAGVTFSHHFAVGTPGDIIAEHAKKAGCDEIVMGVRGLGGLLNLLLGSTTTKVLAQTSLPVVLVK